MNDEPAEPDDDQELAKQTAWLQNRTGLGLYILDDAGAPVCEPDVLKWGNWYGSADRGVALDTIDGVRISTVFLGIDHTFCDFNGPRPVLWETMIFGGKHDGYQERYASRAEAIEGHARALFLVREGHPEVRRQYAYTKGELDYIVETYRKPKSIN